MNDRRLRVAALAAALALALAGCGGGGGGGNNIRTDVAPPLPPPPPPSGDPVVYEPNPEFGRHLSLTGASTAHDAGLSGQGVRIGVIDSGVNRNHPALSPRVVDNLVYIDPERNDLSVDDVVGHGTAVAQILAGTPFGEWPGGIAPGAEIVSARIISDEAPEDDGSGHGNEIDGPIGLSPIHDDLIARDVRIMNNSWGGLYWTNPEATAPIAGEYRPFVIDHGGLVVFSTGNEAFDEPSSMAALPSQPGVNGSFPAADLEVGWLAVAALDSANPTQLASYSNACGVAMDYCLAAPGDIVATGTDDAPDDPTYWGWSGTSFATPIISGAAALVWEAFPYFDNDMVRQTLLGTATDLGAAGVDAVFGHGAVNIAAAIGGPARLDWGDVVVDFDEVEGDADASISHWRNDISGDGGIVKRGTGSLRLYGDSTYAGGTRIEGGLLSAIETTLPGNVSVQSPGGLALFNGAVDGDVQVDGFLWIFGDDPAGFEHAVGGDLVFGPGALFALDVGSRLQVGGTAALDGEVVVTGVTTGYQYSTTAPELILHANGGISGVFDALSAIEGVFLEAELSYTADSVLMDIDRLDVSETAQSMGMAPSALAGAQRVEGAFRHIDGGAAGDVSGFIEGAGALQRTPTASAAEQSLSSLSGELHQAGAALALMAIDDNRHALESRLDRMPAIAGASAWGDRLDGQRPAASMAFDASGWVLGLDQRLGADGRVGVAFGESRGQGWHTLRGDRERSRQVEGQLYAAWNIGDSYLLGRLAHGRSERDVHRQILLGRDAFGVDSDYAYRYDSLGLQFGHRLHWNGLSLTPYLGAQRLQLQRDGFTEQGAAGFGLRADGSTVTADQALAGLRFDHGFRLGGQRWNWHGRIERQQPLQNDGAAIDARFTGIDVWSPIGGEALFRPATVFGLGIDTRLRHGGWLSFGMDGRHQDDRTHGTAFARWSVGF